MAQGVLADRIAVITGANRGIGFAIARTFAREGATCALVVRDRAKGERAASDVANVGALPIVVEADMANRTAIKRAAEELSRRFERIDLLVNNAGILTDEDRRIPASRMEPAIIDETLAVNLLGPIAMSEALLPKMGRGARIINVSSTMGQLTDGSAGYAPAYCISKTALNAYTQALAAAVSDNGILVDSFHPGWARTAMGGPNASVDPDQAAGVALFLATRPPGETGLFWRHPGVVIDW
ncbi:MAG: SDR family NAD(P)-dependent oxidoreductase [Candidatus Eremiobacterales bacterium]|jgi:NAD(P)-dependent dehydrogenase (short-subunit alcohol dehydrogenase family)